MLIEILVPICVSIATIACNEVVIKPVAIKIGETILYDYFPKLFDELDFMMPDLIKEKTPEEIKDFLKYKILQNKPQLSEKQLEKTVKKFIKEYDFLENAKKIDPSKIKKSNATIK
jgi:hypothetical protein